MKKLILLMTFLVFLVGCSAIPIVGPLVSGVVMWVQGEAHKYYNHDSETIYRSVKRTCQELNLQISRDQSFPDGSFYLIAGNNDRFKINIYQVERDIAKLSIRVNIMGDKPYAELIYGKVDEELATIEFDRNGFPTRLRSRTQNGF